MSESIVDLLSLPNDDKDHSPSKKLKLDSAAESTCEESPVKSEAPVTQKTSDDDVFDPVQAILDAGRRCKEEERRRNATEHSVKNNHSTFESDVLSVEGSDEESDSNSEELDEKKSKRPNSSEIDAPKASGKSGKKKSAHMRRNIKDILKPDQLDDLTIAARKEEEERRQRMSLKLQQLQQQQLQLRLFQQAQLLQESLGVSGSGNFSYNTNKAPHSADHLMRKLIRKKHITVSLDESGHPQNAPRKTEGEDECILLSSDDESEKPSTDIPLPQPPSSSVPSQAVGPSGIFAGRITKAVKTRKEVDEVIALSSDDENNAESEEVSLKNARLYVGASGVDISNGRGVEADSDDDCVIISPEPDGEEDVEEKDECSQDILNVPDHLGRVLTNVGHPDEDEDVFLAPQIAKIVKPHQIGGIRFLYDNVVESKDRYNNTSGFGCILAHAMGLGKTLQTAAFCDILLRTVGKTILIIVPINTIQNWLNEFNRFLPCKDNNGAGSDTTYLKKRNMKSKVKKVVDEKPETDANFNNGYTTFEKVETEMIEESILTFNTSLNLDLDSKFPENGEYSQTSSISSQQKMDQDSSRLSSSPQQSEETLLSTDSSADPNISFRNFEVFLLNETVKSLQAREKIITTWASKGGVLLIGYEMYRMLALKKLKKSSRKAMTLVHEERVAEAESLNKIYECLVEPGPDCVICDEGHRIKNSGAGISQALKAIKTKRRVVLTGYPLQNNLMEYWCMVDFVRPNYLGTKAEFSNMFERPIQNGQCADSTYEDKRLMKYRSHVLHSLLEGFVQRRSHLVLRNALPHKEEWVLLVKLTPIQLKIYREFIRYLREDLDSDNASTNPIKAFAVCCKIWNHPDVLWNVVKKNLDLEVDLDIDEVRTVPRTKPRGTGRPRGRPPLSGISLSTQVGTDQFDGPTLSESSFGKSEAAGISLEWAKPLFENYVPEVMENGVKFELLFQLIEESVSAGDKLLVFSQSLLTLDLIEVFLKKRLDWRKFYDYVRLDGSTAGLEREKLINDFNKSTIQKLFIISTRAGSLGINLVGANRVCIFDASWNPCHDSQAVCRVYRYGQIKPCHIYRFVSDCTLEKRIYDRQVSKKGMADRIVDEMNPNTPFKSKDVSSFLVLQHDLLEKLPYIKCDINLEKFEDPVLKNVLVKKGDKITQEPFEHESLLIDQKHQRLSKSEKRLALKNYEQEKKTVANAYSTYTRPSYSQYYSSVNAGASSSYSSGSTLSRYTEQRSQMFADIKSTPGQDMSGSMGNATFDRFELHINALKSRGISVFPVQVHQETFLNDPTGSHDIYISAGERVYILVSQKGTYLRVQGKLLRVPFVGSEMNQEQAEHFVMSLLHIPSAQNGRGRSRTYPVEQQLPPSNMLFQKNPNHLQITNSRNNSGGDVMMGVSNWSRNFEQPQPIMHNSASHVTPFLNDSYGSKLGLQTQNVDSSSHTQSDLQSLSRLTEAFCQQSPSLSTDLYSPDCSKQWSSPSSTPKQDSVVSPPELEVIKLNHTQSSNSSSNSSNSRTNSPYRQSWSNSNEGSNIWGNKESFNPSKTESSSFYTDFTITPLNSNAPPSSRKPGQILEKYWHSNDIPPQGFSSKHMHNHPTSTDVSNHGLGSSAFPSFGNSDQYGVSPDMNLQTQNLGIDLSTNNNSSTLEMGSNNLIDRNAGTLFGSSYNNYNSKSHNQF